MTATTRLLWIETRRSVALLFAPALAGLVGWGTLTTMRPDNAPTLWARSSIQLGLMFLVAALIMCGVGAWVAGRDRRRQVEELLATTPRPLPLHDLTLLAGALVWGLVACLVAGAYVLVVTQREATWGGPEAAPIAVGLLSVVTFTALGYLGGVLVRSRFAAPIVAVTLAGAVFALGATSSSTTYLSPLALDPRGYSPYELFYRPSPIPALQMSLWLAGLTGCALAGVALRRRRSLPAVVMFVVALAVAVSGAQLVRQAVTDPPWLRDYVDEPLAAYEPACVQRTVQICVHPAYRASLDDDAERIGRLVEPLLGIPGGPTRAEQLPTRTGLRADGTLEILPGGDVVGIAAYDLVRASGQTADLTPAQLAVAAWLVERTGEPGYAALRPFGGAGQPEVAIMAALERFSALAPAAQRAWLEQHYNDLRAGRVSLDELP